MIMITVADSGSLSLMETFQDFEIQILGCGSCCHYNHVHHCSNGSNQLPYSLKLVILAMESND